MGQEIKISGNVISSKKLHEAILNSLTFSNDLTDISNVNVNEYYKSEHNEVISTSDIFIDNIMIYKIFKKSDVITEKNKLFLNTNNRKVTNYEIKECFRSEGFMLNPLAVKIRHVISGDTNENSYIMKRINKNITLNNFVATFKVSLSDFDADKLTEKFPKLLKTLQLKGYDILDVDLTRDFKGSFDEKNVIDYLESQDHILLKSFSNSCISYIQDDSRIKIYNKIACQFKSPGVTVNFGSNLMSYINCNQKRLRKSFENSIEEGLIRIEVSSKNIEKGKLLLNEAIQSLKNINIYFTPAYFQLKSLTDKIRQTVCILDRTKSQYYFCYYSDLKANKFIGYKSNKCKFTETSYKLILSMFSIKNVPVLFVDANIVDENYVLKISRYVKPEGNTIITSSTSMFAILDEDISKFKLDQTGIEFTTLKKAYKIKSKPLYEMKEIKLLDDFNITLCSRQMHKRRNEQSEFDRKQTEIEANKDLIADNVKQKVQEVNIEYLETLPEPKLKTNYSSTTKHPFQNQPRKITGLPNMTVFKVIGFTTNFDYIVTDIGVYENIIPFKFDVNLLNNVHFKIRHFPSFYLVLSKLVQPLFVVRKQSRTDYELIDRFDFDQLKHFKLYK